MNIRANKKHQNDSSIQEVRGTDNEGNEIKIEDKISLEGYRIEDEVMLRLQAEHLYDTLDVLKEMERQVIEMRYGLNGNKELTQKEIGALLKISRSYVSRIETKALKKLNKEMSI